jgi:DNA-binding LacI/PurR family transcriptional regulator
LGEAGLEVPAMLPSHPGDDASTRRAVAAVLAAPVRPEVLVCDTDQSALVAIDELAAAGLRVPEDVAVTGFDGVLAGRLVRPAVTTVRQPMEEVGRAAVRVLLDALRGASPEAGEPLACTVFVGGTCGTH